MNTPVTPGTRTTTAGLRVRALEVQRAGRTVVYGLDFDTPRGQITALIGPNGAGKSSVLRGLLGLEKIRGQVRLDGEELLAMNSRARARRMAWVPQKSELSVDLLVEEVVLQGRFAWREPLLPASRRDRQEVLQALHRVGAEALARRPFRQLSGGEQQRVLLARALASGASMLLLDEPTSSLDIGTSLRFFELLRAQASQGACVLVVLHGLGEARALADGLVLLHNGRRVAAGPPTQVVTDEHLGPTFGVHVRENLAPAFLPVAS